MDAKELFFLITQRAEEVIAAESLKRKLAARKKLRVKLGVDPTAPDLHLGHAVPLRMLKTFQDAGHRAILIIGDFTARIGDPAGQVTGRRPLSVREVHAHGRTYLRQAGRILDLRRTEVRHNSEWHGELRLEEFLELLASFPLRTAIERDDFQRRLRAGQEVRLHEAMYPVLQAYDSVAVEADVELGGLDQKLNLLAGRELQRSRGQEPQELVLLPYLIGLDGTRKMSKTFGNAIGFREGLRDMFGKVMSIPDQLIAHYAELAAWMPPERVNGIRRRLRRGENPRGVKLDLAEAVVALYHGATKAHNARGEFIQIFTKRELPKTLPTVRLAQRTYQPLRLLLTLGVARSKSEARRLLAGEALEVNGRIVRLTDTRVAVAPGATIRVGKRKFFRVG